MDVATPDHIDLLLRVGAAAGQRVKREHFGAFIG
jgi:hypothetical protein